MPRKTLTKTRNARLRSGTMTRRRNSESRSGTTTGSRNSQNRTRTTTRSRSGLSRSGTADRSRARDRNRSSFRTEEADVVIRHPHAMDYSIVFLVIFLVGFGLVMIYSTSSYKGSLYMGDAAYWLKRQAVFAVIGLLAMFFLARIDYHILNLKRWFPYVYYVGIILLLFFTIAFASVTNGSKRWLTIGPISFQSSEMAKLVIIVVLAIYISQKARELRTTRGIIKAFALTIPIIGVVGIENLSTSIILLAISVIMIFVASNKWLPFLAVGAVGVAGAVALLVTQSYRMGRILVWLHPEDYDNGLQTLQGLYAIGSGGLFGKGLGNSMQKMGFLPETHNDMIFSIICEELGLFGAVRVIILYFVLIWRFMIVAVNAADLYGSMIVIGVIAHIGIQVFINIGVVTNTIPNTGIPLPFISYGGTSLCFLLIEMGLVLSVSRYMRLRE